MELTRRIVQQPALQAYAPEEYAPGSQFNSMEELVRRAGDISTTIFHPAGTLKMGPCSGAQADPMAVVDSRLRLRSVGSTQSRRLQRHADPGQRQHLQPDPDDRREGRALDSRPDLSAEA